MNSSHCFCLFCLVCCFACFRGRPERWKRLWSYFFRNGAGVKNRSDSYDLDKAHFSNNALGAVDSLQYRNKFPNNGDSDDPSRYTALQHSIYLYLFCCLLFIQLIFCVCVYLVIW